MHSKTKKTWTVAHILPFLTWMVVLIVIWCKQLFKLRKTWNRCYETELQLCILIFEFLVAHGGTRIILDGVSWNHKENCVTALTWNTPIDALTVSVQSSQEPDLLSIKSPFNIFCSSQPLGWCVFRTCVCLLWGNYLFVLSTTASSKIRYLFCCCCFLQ